MPDGNIETNQANIKKIIHIIRSYQPKIVFAPFPSDRHPDHVNASNLIKESFFYTGLVKIQTGNLAAFRPKRIFYYQGAFDIPVSFVFDISKTFIRKLKALKCYSTQFYNPENKKPETFISTEIFDKWIEARARNFGFKIGVEYGEPYFSNESIKVDNETLFDI